MTRADAATTRTLYENLGRGLIALVRNSERESLDRHGELILGPLKAAVEADLGKRIDALIGAVVKAVIVGRQTDKQIREAQQKARQAFARALARKMAKLPPGTP